MSDLPGNESAFSQSGAPFSGGKRKKGNGHKETCGCPICNNMKKKGKKGGVLLVGGALKCSDGSDPQDDGTGKRMCKDADGYMTVEPQDDGIITGMEGGRRGRRSRSRSKSRSRSRSKSRSRSSPSVRRQRTA